MEYPNTLIHPADYTGCGNYRIIQPAICLSNNNVKVFNSDHYLLENEIKDRNVQQVIGQRINTSSAEIERLELYKKWNVAIRMDLDDLLWQTPACNPFHALFKSKNLKIIKQAMNISNSLIASTEPLKLEMQKLARNAIINVLPNLLRKSHYREPLPRPRGNIGKMRIGWAGSATHYSDIMQLEYVIKSTKPIYQWVFFGYCPPELLAHVEYHPFVDYTRYISKLKSLNLHVAVAPLVINRFNECKSHVKLLEYSAIGLPTITTKITPYVENPNVSITSSKSQHREWFAILDSYAKNEFLRQEHASKAFDWSIKYVMEENIDRIIAAWFPNAL